MPSSGTTPLATNGDPFPTREKAEAGLAERKDGAPAVNMSMEINEMDLSGVMRSLDSLVEASAEYERKLLASFAIPAHYLNNPPSSYTDAKLEKE